MAVPVTAWLAVLECGHEARLRGSPAVGGYVTCADGRCQGQRRVAGVQPDPATYVAPARYPLTVLHCQDPRNVAVVDMSRDGLPVDGWTMCGLPMLWDELWVPVERREGDAVCWVCEAEDRAATVVQETVQEALL